VNTKNKENNASYALFRYINHFPKKKTYEKVIEAMLQQGIVAI
jgi:hypothetical protein